MKALTLLGLITLPFATALPLLAEDWTINEAEGVGSAVRTQVDNPEVMVSYQAELHKLLDPKSIVAFCIQTIQEHPNSAATTVSETASYLCKNQKPAFVALLIRQASAEIPTLTGDFLDHSLRALGSYQGNMAVPCLVGAMSQAKGTTDQLTYFNIAQNAVKNNQLAVKNLNAYAQRQGLELQP